VRRVGVTGAAGFVGRVLAARLRADGHEVVGIDVAALGPDVRAADIRRPGAWQDALATCDAIVHTAALVSQTASHDAAWAANVVGTRRVLDACTPTTRIVHCSSSAVYSPDRPPQVEESHPVRPTGRPYGDTKIASEQVVLAAQVAGEADVVVLRPGDVYGAGSRPWTEIPVATMRAGRMVLPAFGRGLIDPVYVDDLVDCVLAALTTPAPQARVYNVAGGAPVTAAAFFGEYSRRLGLLRPRFAPTAVAVLLAEGLGRAQRLRGARSELGAGSIAMLTKTGGMSIARAQRELGWAPRIDLAEGMRRTCAAIAARG
jgi:nucleoside-diphosphate-sugar epimerase